jgi:hypothetical protein
VRSSPPGVGGVFQDKSFSGTAACPARQVCGLTHAMLGAMRVRDSPPKGLPLAFCNIAIRACQPQNLPRTSFFGRFPLEPRRNLVCGIRVGTNFRFSSALRAGLHF